MTSQDQLRIISQLKYQYYITSAEALGAIRAKRLLEKVCEGSTISPEDANLRVNLLRGYASDRYKLNLLEEVRRQNPTKLAGVVRKLQDPQVYDNGLLSAHPIVGSEVKRITSYKSGSFQGYRPVVELDLVGTLTRDSKSALESIDRECKYYPGLESDVYGVFLASERDPIELSEKMIEMFGEEPISPIEAFLELYEDISYAADLVKSRWDSHAQSRFTIDDEGTLTTAIAPSYSLPTVEQRAHRDGVSNRSEVEKRILIYRSSFFLSSCDTAQATFDSVLRDHRREEPMNGIMWQLLSDSFGVDAMKSVYEQNNIERNAAVLSIVRNEPWLMKSYEQLHMHGIFADLDL